jgi:mannitol/fructose-specific phosphotransferase system IIA component (Ntr-type)
MKDSFPPVQSLLSPERCVILERTDKQEAIGELVATLWRSVPTLDYSSIFGAIWDREIQLTTRISPEIAMPHAQIAGMTESYICLGLNPTGIAYDPKEEALVRLLVMLVGPPAEHLKILSTLARLLENEERLQALLSAEDAIQLYTAFKMTSSSAVSDVAEQADPLNSKPYYPPKTQSNSIPPSK